MMDQRFIFKRRDTGPGFGIVAACRFQPNTGPRPTIEARDLELIHFGRRTATSFRFGFDTVEGAHFVEWSRGPIRGTLGEGQWLVLPMEATGRLRSSELGTVNCFDDEAFKIDFESWEIAAPGYNPNGLMRLDQSIEDEVMQNVASIEYYNPVLAPHLTIAVVKLKNGFIITGSEIPADPALFDAEKGKKWAVESAMRQMVVLHVYAQKDAAARQQAQ